MAIVLLRFDLRRAPFSPVSHDALYTAALELAAHADEQGYTAIALSEHHALDDGFLPSPLILAAALAGRTRRIRIQIAALLAPLYDPVKLAEDLLVLDHASRGRVSTTLGMGYRPEEYASLGRDFAARGRLLDECLELLLRAFTGESFDLAGAPGARGRRRPSRARTRPSASAGRARRGRGGPRASGCPTSPRATTPRWWRSTRRSVARLGRRPLLLPPGSGEMIWVARDPERAFRELAPYLLYEATSYASWQPLGQQSTVLSRAKTAEELWAEGKYRVLTPEACVERARREGPLSTFVLLPAVRRHAARARLAERAAVQRGGAAADPVIVVGAGPAGAALAHALASRGIATTLIERQRDFAREFRGEALLPSGVDALAQLGLAELIEQAPHQQPDSVAVYRDGKLALALRMADLLPAGARVFTVSQPHLLEGIVASASRQPGFRFLRGAAVRELLRDSAGRVCGVRLEDEQGSREERARFVVGADGRASVVRRRGGFAVRRRGAPLDVVWAKLPWPPFYGDARPVRAYLGHAHLLIALPAPDGLLQLAWVIRKGSYGELRARGAAEWVGEMAAHVSPDLAAHLRAHAGDLSRPFLLDAETDRVLGWAATGVLLIGDAAHTMSPVGAQGLNVALRDAVVAANHLVPPLRGAAPLDSLDRAARGVEPERGPEIDRIQTLAAGPPRVVMGSFPGAEWVRAAVLGLVRSGLLAPLLRRGGALLLYGEREVKLTV